MAATPESLAGYSPRGRSRTRLSDRARLILEIGWDTCSPLVATGLRAVRMGFPTLCSLLLLSRV